MNETNKIEPSLELEPEKAIEINKELREQHEIKEKMEKFFQNNTNFGSSSDNSSRAVVLDQKQVSPKEVAQIVEAIPNTLIKKDKFNKFKNMLVTYKARLDPSIVFKNANKPDWYEVGHKAGLLVYKIEEKSKPLYEQTLNFLNITARSLNILIKKAPQVPEYIQDGFLMVGEKRNVLRLEKKFTKTLQELGISAKEVLLNPGSNDTSVISSEKTLEKIQERLKTNHGVKIENSQYQLEILDGLNDNMKLEMIKTMMWPKLKKDLTENWQMTVQLKESIVYNKYIKMVTDFSIQNQLNDELVFHSLGKNPDILKGYTGADKLINNKEEILKNSQKYENFMSHTMLNLSSLVMLGESIEQEINNLKVSEKSKKELIAHIQNTELISTPSGLKISYLQAKKNLISANNLLKEMKKPSDEEKNSPSP